MSRRALVAQLQRRVTALTARRTGFALALCGPPGIGKSRTVNDLLSASGLRVIRLRSSAPWPELARVWRDVSDLPAWASSVFRQLEHAQDMPGTDWVKAFAVALGGQAPSVLWLEDLHECNPERLRAWITLAHMLQRERGAALMGTSRGALPEVFESCWLKPLSPNELGEVLANEIRVPLPMEVLNWLCARTAGNPLFALEFLRGMRRTGGLWLDEGVWGWRSPLGAALPGGVEALIEQILDGVGPAAKRLLELYTVLQNEFFDETLGSSRAAQEQKTLWEAVSGLDTQGFALARAELEQTGIVLPKGGWVHPLYREVATKRVPPAVRRADASAAALALEPFDPLKSARLIPLSDLSGDAAARIYNAAVRASPDSKTAFSWEVLALAHAPRAVRVEGALALLEQLDGGNIDQERQLLEIALEVNPNHLVLVGRRARLSAREGEAEQARAWLEPFAPHDAPRDAAWEVEWLRLLATLNEFGELMQRWDARPELHEALTPANGSSFVGVLGIQGRFREGEALFEHLMTQAPSKVQTARLCNALGVLYENAGDDAAALKAYERAVTFGASPEQSLTVRLALGNLAMVLDRQHRHTEAGETFARVARAALEAGDLLDYARIQALRAANQVSRGAFEAAETLYLEAYGLLSNSQNPLERFECEMLMARMYALWGGSLHVPLALRHAEAALRLARASGNRRALADALNALAFAEGLIGDPGNALKTVEAFERETNGSQPDQVNLLRALALLRLERRTEAEGLLLQVLEGKPSGPNMDLVWLELDRVRGDQASARARTEGFRGRGYGLGLHLIERYFPAGSAAPERSWQVNLLGPFEVTRAGAPVKLRGEKRKSLLARLLEASLSGSNGMRSDALANALYPDMTDEDARAALKQLVFQVRSALGAEVVLSIPQGYALGEVGSDVKGFLETGDSQLWRGVYLEDVLEDRDLALGVVAEQLTDLLRQTAQRALAADPREAARLARILLKADPFDRSALALALRAYRVLGQHTALRRVYAAALERWLAVGERLPEGWRDFLVASEPEIVQNPTSL
jgi:DNA-binding SARP family transcriptional activator